MRIISTALSALLWLCWLVQPAFAQGACYQWCVINSAGSKTSFCNVNPEAAYTAFLNAQDHGVCGGGASLPRTVYRTSDGETTKIYNFHTPGCDGSPGPYYNTSGGFGPLAVARESSTCPDPCTAEASQAIKTNLTICYTRDGAGVLNCATSPYFPTAGQPICVNGCKRGLNNANAVWQSQAVTSTGMYRMSADYDTIGIGQACEAGEVNSTPANPAASIPECTGSLGTVNGKPYCAGTAANPVANDTPLPPGMPPPGEGNPPAGDVPTTGPGSGSTGADRTPAVGNGGPAGGPAGAAGSSAGGGGTGTVPTPGEGQEQAACGAPGQPPCRLDETGTPKVQPGQWDNAADQYKTTRDANRGTMSGEGDKGFFNGWSSFFFAPPVAQCVPFTMPSMQGMAVPDLDPCAVVDGVRQVMAYIWALTALYLCVGMVTRTVRGTS